MSSAAGRILAVVIRAVVVDLDGVLRTWERRPLAVLEARYGLPDGTMAAVAFDDGRLLPAFTGAVSDEEWRAGIRAELVGRYGPGGAAAVAAWSRDPGELVPEVVEMVSRQRPGRVVAVLTNATSGLEDRLDRLGRIHDQLLDLVAGLPTSPARDLDSGRCRNTRWSGGNRSPRPAGRKRPFIVLLAARRARLVRHGQTGCTDTAQARRNAP